jgi:hypothetical protein
MIEKMNYNDAWISCCKLGMQLLYFDDEASMEADLKCLEDWNNSMIKCIKKNEKPADDFP